MATLDQAIDQMRGAGMPDFPPGHPRTNTPRIVRYGPKGKAWYRLYEYPARNGRYYIAGAFGMWGEIDATKIETDWTGVDQAERERLQRSQAELEAREREKRAQRVRFAAGRARSQWNEARSTKPATIATYLERKGVEHEKGLRYFADGTLLVPMLRYDVTEAQESDPNYTGPRRLVGLQKIAPDGVKRFNKGMAAEAAAFRLGPAPRAGDLILIAEGVATGLTLRQATDRKFSVFVLFNAGNLVPAGKILRALYPSSPMLFCADDDAYIGASMNRLLRENFGVTEILRPPLTNQTTRGRAGEILVSADLIVDGNDVPGLTGAVTVGDRVHTFARSNAGRLCAHQAAAEVGNAEVVFPVFKDRKLTADPDQVGKLTDFNDLHKAEGLGAVRAQLDGEIRRFELSREVGKIVKAELGKAKKKASTKPPEPPARFDWRRFFERFTLIYPTDTVYDAELEVIAKLSHIKIAFGDGVVKWWLESAERRTVNADRVVFDPAGKSDPATTINLFRGLPPPPAAPAGGCERLLELLQFLCGEAGQDQAPVTEWVLNWLAYPLQHVGAKMASAIVMHGQSEGTGKNLFFNTIRDIYGRYGALITQAELESPYNAWMSQRLFMIANEVISRQELRHHVGRLKNLITESPLPIAEKYLPTRYEDNHMNMVFLTNELHALQISPSDRRYMVIRTPAINQPEFYKGVVAELAAGGAVALHRYLLDRDCGEFNEHTKPLMTAAKEDLIEIGLNSPQQFQIELHDGLLHPLEYGPALVNDVYEVYSAWCARTGVKNPRPRNYFSHEFMAMNGVSRKKERVADPDRHEERALSRSNLPQRMVFLMGQRSEAVPHEKWLQDGIDRFREASRGYLRNAGLRRQPRSEEPEQDNDPGPAF